MIHYDKIKSEASKTESDRNKVLNSRGSKVIPRRYHLSDSELLELKKFQEKTGQFPNPYSRSGIYYYFIEALVHLGCDRSHEFLTVKNKIKELMSKDFNKKHNTNEWEVFNNKDCNWDSNMRIYQTATILQRINSTNPFGYKLLQLSALIVFEKSTHKIIKKNNIKLKLFNCMEDAIEFRNNEKSIKAELELFNKE